VVFTDIETSTERATSLGGQRWRELLDAQDRVPRAASALDLRVGHTGESEVWGEDLGGLAVHIAARVCGLPRSGEVLVSGTVKDLVARSGIEFTERGEHELNGAPRPWRLFALDR
jgi:class 3 adenylate cyclase